MTGDFIILEQASTTGGRGGRLYNIASGTAINAGEPVARALGAVAVTPCATNAGTVGTDYVVGVATTNSTNTASAAGTVNVIPLNSGATYLVNPKVAATWTPQSSYDALVGKRVLIDLTSGAYTLLASDSAANGFVVQAMNINEHPGKVAVAFRAALSDLA
jgi:hypothetical protein